MKTKALLVLAFIAFFIMNVLPCSAQETIQESSTKKLFPKDVSFTYNDMEYKLTATGVTVRKKFIFKVYGVAHYMEDPVSGSFDEVLDQVLTDGKAKQITMDFARDVGSNKIQNAYREGFEKNSTEDEYKGIKAEVDQFVGFFDKEVKEDEQYILRWLPGGTVITIVQGEEKEAITNPTFAKTLWTIWFGNKSIVKRDKLIELIVSES